MKNRPASTFGGLFLVLGLTLFFMSCDDSSEEKAYRDFGGNRAGSGKAERSARKRKKKSGTGLVEADADKDKDKLSLPELNESVFVTGLRHRDPFAPFLEVLVKREAISIVPVQRTVKLKDYDVSELKLIGIITNIGDPRAMVTTPDKTGFVLRRGDYVGRADFVKQGSSGAPIQVNWKVARIHGAGKEEERGIYLTRQDPAMGPGGNITRFIPLHPIE